jgi:hypothetical protein
MASGIGDSIRCRLRRDWRAQCTKGQESHRSKDETSHREMHDQVLVGVVALLVVVLALVLVFVVVSRRGVSGILLAFKGRKRVEIGEIRAKQSGNANNGY